jgi:hypothetical protein
MEMLVMVRAAFPGLPRLIVMVPDELPTLVPGKVRGFGFSVAWGAGAVVAVPEIVAVWGEPAALSTTEMEALRVPVVVGVKVMVMMHALSSARLAGQLLVWEKLLALAPVMEMLVMVRAAFPGLPRLIVMVPDELPTLVLGKVTGLGFRVA